MRLRLRLFTLALVAGFAFAPAAQAHRLSGHPTSLHAKMLLAKAQLAHDRSSGANHWLGRDRAYVRKLRGQARSLAAVSRPVGFSSGGWLITAYCLSGHTATGASVGPGVIAVDPSVIPLGSHLWVAGYGSGVALDTGRAIVGHHVDVWMESCSAAMSSTHYGVVRWWR